ncbi:polyprenyl synthetase family protein [Streptomyces kronopolitis]|uniref:polyprenyl synthetase family protein n=1 Tax=Streptomyces kronopolitis TaxID=1612435 RepID=UPI0036BE16D0
MHHTGAEHPSRTHHSPAFPRGQQQPDPPGPARARGPRYRRPITWRGAASVDRDVPAAVGSVLGDILRDRTASASALDEVFGRDVAERIARFTLDGGKRLRSQFLWWALRACGGGQDHDQVHRALRIAAALELIQTCALVHDDLTDASRLRRGRPTLHADITHQYADARRPGASEPLGTAAALLGGDLALAWADDTVAHLELPPEVGRRVQDIWTAMRTEMAAGQYLDLRAQATGATSLSEAIRIAYLKSGLYSVERPLALGAALAGADETATRALRAAGRSAGVAFQLRDDLHGVFGDPGQTGKPSGDDIREGKLTTLVAVARTRAVASDDQASVAVLDGCVGSAELTPADLAEVRHVLVVTGARSAVETKIARLVTQSIHHLTAAGLEPRARRRLHGLVCTAAGTSTTSSSTSRPPEEPGPPPPSSDDTADVDRW